MSSSNFIITSILASTLFLATLFIYTNSQTSEAAVLTPNTKIKVNLDTSFSLNVRRTPAGDRIGTQPNGAEGTKVGEPEQANGRMWQNVDFDPQGQDSKDGWVAASLIVPVVIVKKPDWPQGELPRMTRDGFT